MGAGGQVVGVDGPEGLQILDLFVVADGLEDHFFLAADGPNAQEIIALNVRQPHHTAVPVASLLLFEQGVEVQLQLGALVEAQQ